MERYDPTQIEPKWQRVWADEHTWEVSNEPDDRPKAYVLEMLPYPSGEPHIGHLKTYSVGDAVAHFRRRNGYRVLHPMGYDAFGLPAENHAIKTGQHPRESTEASIVEFQRQFRRWGVSIDWTREFGTHEPRILPLDPVDLPEAVREGARLPQGGRRQLVSQGRHRAGQRAGDRRALRALRHRGRGQAARAVVLSHHRLRGPAARRLRRRSTGRPNVVTMQENWIGRSEGAEVVFRCEELGIDYPVFTTRPDTLFGATFFVMAPEHPDVFRLNDSPEVHEYVNHAVSETAEERGDEHKREDRRGARPHRHQPGHRRADPDVRRRLRADGVRHRGDHGRARPRRARLRVRPGVRPAESCG